MIEIFDKETGSDLGTITEGQLRFLIDQLEEESENDDDYYINSATIDNFEDLGADPELIALLRRILGDRNEMEIRWKRT